MTLRPGVSTAPGAEPGSAAAAVADAALGAPDAVVGRDVVLDQAGRSLSGGGTVLIEGPPGIGKTAVWRHLVRTAERDGWLVLACAPAEAEAALPLAALADLLGPLADRIPELPDPQRVALEIAVLSGAAGGEVDERALGAGTRALLDAAAQDAGATKVLVAVDDAHWLDLPSERALRFALRRAVPQLAVLVTSRADSSVPPAPLGLDREPLAVSLRRIELRPLGVGALHHILRQRLGATLGRPLLARIASDAGGNPLLAIELARAVLRLPRLPAPGADLPVARSLQQLLSDLLGTLPEASRAAVRLAALLAVPTLHDLAAAGVPSSAFDAAEDAGLLVVAPDAIKFTHPAHAAGIRAGIPPGVRRHLHRQLASVVADKDERARLLAQCTTRVDPEVARELAEAASRRRARGAPELAAQLYQRAAELTPPERVADRRRHRLAAARCQFESGDYAAAGAAADAVADTASDTTLDRAAERRTGTAVVADDDRGELRAEAMLLRASVAWMADDIDTAAQAAERGLAAVPAGSALAGRIHAHLSVFRDSPDLARTHAEAATALLEDSTGDRALLAGTYLQLFFNEVRGGRPARTELLDRALELERGEPSWLGGTVPAIWWKSIDDYPRARERLLTMLHKASERGDEPTQHEVLTHLGDTELLAGDWAAAAEHVTSARELGEQLGTGLVGETWLGGLLDAHRGRLAEAGAVAEAGLRRSDEAGDLWARRIHLHLAGLVALSAGRMVDAARDYADLARLLDQLGLVDALAVRFEPDWVEACVGTGDLVTARVAMARLAERHRRLPRPWTALGLARSRALIDSATGADPTPALDQLGRAMDVVPAGAVPLDRARCLLVAGVVHRRARRKREARDALQAAGGEFKALGANAFAERAAAELARVGSRPIVSGDLTATEDRVARLAAAGHTNRSIADALFVSPKTVEANLARAYRKLGISRRAELGTAMARGSAPEGGRLPG
jgi:DNA-binding CsgD family transcriptional regulator